MFSAAKFWYCFVNHNMVRYWRLMQITSHAKRQGLRFSAAHLVYLRESQVTNVSFLLPRHTIVIYKHSTIPAFFAYLLGFAVGFGVWWRSVTRKVHRLKSLPIFPVDIKFQSSEWLKKGCWSSAFFRWSYVLLSLVEVHAYLSTFLLYVCLMMMMKELVWCSVRRWTMAIQWHDYEQMIEPIVLSKRGPHWVVLIDGRDETVAESDVHEFRKHWEKDQHFQVVSVCFKLRSKQLSAQRFGHTKERSTHC